MCYDVRNSDSYLFYGGVTVVNAQKGNIDVKGLASLYQNNTAARAFFEYAACRQRNTRTTPIERIQKVLGQEVSRSELIGLFKELGKMGCGHFVAGRKGHPTRFEWQVGLVSVGRAACGESEEIEETIDDDYETIDLLTHTFHLRPDVPVEFDLPRNLTENEASRLADYIRTLPFRE